MSLLQTVWKHVLAEMPPIPKRQRTWTGFLLAAYTGLVIIAFWFPIRLTYELFKTINFTPKPDHRLEAQELFRQATLLAHDLPSSKAFVRSVLRHTDLPMSLHKAFQEALSALYAQNMLLAVPPVPSDLDGLEGIRWRDRLRLEIPRMNEETLIKMRHASLAAIEATVSTLPKIAGDGEITAPLATLTNAGKLVEALVQPLDAKLFPAFAARFEENALRLSGLSKTSANKSQRVASPREFDDPQGFLEGTALDKILATRIGTDIPQRSRSSHHWIVAGTGAGKTNALQYLISKDLERASRGECSIVVIDSQHQLIERLSNLKFFAAGQKLDGKLCLLDAADIEFPIAINLFDMKLDRLNAMSPLEREKLTNSALEMYDFIIGSLLQAEMTSRQSTLFQFVTRALFAIPEATIHTFHDILQHGLKNYPSEIAKLDETTRHFFATDFNSSQFKQTKEQVTARLWAVLGNQTFRRMFSSKHSKVDLFAEINTPGKIILINAEKSLLKEEGTELFGRFFLALINQAAAQRASLPVAARLHCFVYVDECHNYIRNDPKVQIILADARQQNVGLILAHQYLSQIEAPVLRGLAANTSIKMAARLEAGDRSAMSRDMNCTPDFIRDQQVGSFASFVRGETPVAISMQFPLDPLSKFGAMTLAERKTVLARNRAIYANPIVSESQNAKKEMPEADLKNSWSNDRRDPDA
jgi:hypothetical protein